MNTSKLLAFSLVIALLFNISCDSISTKSQSEYPATLAPLSNQRLNQKIEGFHKANDSHICSKLDNYGLTIGKGCSGPVYHSDTPIQKNKAIALAEQILVKNKTYTNVSNIEKLHLNRAYSMYSGNNEWRVDFQNQVYHGLEVNNTSIVVWLNAKGAYRIGGYWYNDITIPAKVDVSRSDALKAAVGYQIDYSDWTGTKHFVATKETLASPADLKKIILPYQNKVTGHRELRVIWQIPTANNYFHIFVDVISGNVLDYRQIVVF